MSLADQLEALAGGGSVSPERAMARPGLTMARVTNVSDEAGYNRVKCLPIGSGNEEETDWCYVMAPMGGKGRGMFFPPQVDDLVILAYLDEDPHRPLVLGSYWNTEVEPPHVIQEGKVEDYILRTPRKIDLQLHDEEGKERVTLTMPSEAVLTLDDGEKTAALRDQGGDNGLTLKFEGGEVELKAKTKLTLSAGDTQIVLESSGNITIKGGGKISVEGASLDMKASGQLNAQGATAAVKSSGTLELSASGPATVKGAIVKLN